MNNDKKYSGLALFLSPYIILTLVSCADTQPAYECAAVNHDVYSIKYIKQSSSCPADAGFITNALVGGSAGLESYMLISLDGGGGPNVVFRDVPGNVDRSATKFGLRLQALVSNTAVAACDDNLNNNCATPDPVLACGYCVTGDGGATTPYKFEDGGPAEDVNLPDGGRQGVSVPTPDGGTKRVSLANSCIPGKKDNVARASSASTDPNIFMMFPRYPVNEICSPFDGGISPSTTTFPEYKCKDSTTIPATTIVTTVSNFKLISSARILGTFAKAQISFEETTTTGLKCTTNYKIVLLNPRVYCLTDVDCSPDAVPDAEACTTPEPELTDRCHNRNPDDAHPGASNIIGSGISPFLYQKYPDGGFDYRDTCDPVLKVCIWDSDAGGL